MAAKAKKEVRQIVAADQLANLIDRGATVDIEIKNFGYEDKGLKTKISEQVSTLFSEGEQSLRFDGKAARALVSKVESCELNTGADTFVAVKAALDKGLLKDVVSEKQVLSVPPSVAVKAAEILKAAGLAVSLATSYEVDPDSYRELLSKATSTVEEDEARKALAAAVKKDTTYRIKYEVKEAETPVV